MVGVVIVDYGAGNLKSVAKAVEHLGWQPLVTSRPEAVANAEALILPGVGAAADTMRNLHARGLVAPLREFIAQGRPFLGVCMGLQALMTVSEESGEHDCLDIIPGRVRRLAGGAGLKIPHMGWNTVTQIRPHPIFHGVPDGTYFYFVHSYVVDPVDRSCVIAQTEYGQLVPAVIARGNVVATQFHPEKSGRNGLRIYANFITQALGEQASTEPQAGARALGIGAP